MAIKTYKGKLTTAKRRAQEILAVKIIDHLEHWSDRRTDNEELTALEKDQVYSQLSRLSKRLLKLLNNNRKD